MKEKIKEILREGSEKNVLGIAVSRPNQELIIMRGILGAEKSPMSAKSVMKENKDFMVVEPHSMKDVNNMKFCLTLKLRQHPELVNELINTGDKTIIEDVTARGDVGGNLFWGCHVGRR